MTSTVSQGGAQWRRIGFGTVPGSWHPNSQQFAFSSYAKSLPTVKVVQLPDFQVKSLEGKGYILDQPAWSPNGRSLIAYGSDLTVKGEHDTTEIYGDPVAHYLAILNMRGKITRKVRPGGLPDALKLSAINWSPDSKRVSYASYYSLSSGPGLDVVNIASGKATYLPHITGFVEVPAPWLNEKWLLLNLPDYKDKPSGVLSGGVATSTLPAQRFYFGEQAGGNSGYIQQYLRGKNNLFYVVLDNDKTSMLWRGQITPTPHLTTRLQTFPKSITAFDARHQQLWVVDRNSHTATPIPLT